MNEAIPSFSRPMPSWRNVSVLREFLQSQAGGGMVLLLAAALAMIMANSPLASLYQAFRAIPVHMRVGSLEIAKPLLLWVNDGLMAVFFLLVALEIKREFLSGQLASRVHLILPLVCAFAGAMVPALLFVAFNHANPAAVRGWAVPTATDIAFALGVLALLGSRVPMAMKLLLSTIAVIDDLLAVLIIALFYTDALSALALACAAMAAAALWFLNRAGVVRLTPYLVLGALLWVCVLKSGLHATLAGVITGLLIPHRVSATCGPTAFRSSSLEALEHALHPVVAYAIVPLFAFVNAGLALSALSWRDVVAPLPMGIAIGLFVGKPVGIVGAAVVLRALGWARFPMGMNFNEILGLGLMCGIGFTMSLFIGSLAYDEPEYYQGAALGVLLASVLSAMIGYAWLALCLPKVRK